VFKDDEGQATTETAGARNDLRPSVMRKETRKQALLQSNIISKYKGGKTDYDVVVVVVVVVKLQVLLT